MTVTRGRETSTGRLLQLQCSEATIASMRQLTDEPCDDWLAPGFIDLQVNGYGGIDLNSDSLSVEEVVSLTQRLARIGTTRYLPTLITASTEKLLHLLQIIRRAREEDDRVRHAVVGVHLEGPYISGIEGYRGAHDAAHVRQPSIEEFGQLQNAAGGLIRLITLSPHWPQSPVFIRAVSASGVIVAIGHTSATCEQIAAAAHAGATLSTHLGNGLPLQLQRHPNPIWGQLALDSLFASFIADGIHVDAATLTSMLRAKGRSRSILISDSVALAGSSPGTYATSVGGAVVVADDGSIRLRDSPLLAGSGIALRDAVARCVTLSGLSLGDVVEMVTTHPATLLGLQSGLSAGAPADLVQFRWKPQEQTLHIQNVIVRGALLAAGADAQA